MPPGGAKPPIGAGQATGPSQNLGTTAEGNQIAAMILQGLTLAMTKIPPGSELGKAISKAHYEIGKHIEPGAASPAGVSNSFKKMAMQHQQMAPHAGAMATQGAAPPGAGPPGAGAAPPQPPPAA